MEKITTDNPNVPENLADALLAEIRRNQELLAIYKTIPTGEFGVMMLMLDIQSAENALASGDVIKMLTAYNKMVNNE